MTDNNIFKKRAEKTREWISDPYNLSILGIVVLSLMIRVYFWIKFGDQTFWWDESEYGASAKYIYGIIDSYPLNPQRPFMFLGLIGSMYFIGIAEQLIKFFVVVVPSTFLVFCVYLLGKEMFDKQIGIISASLACMSWTFLFWTTRLQPDFLSMCFQILSIYYMWTYWQRGGTKSIIFSGLFASLGFQFKVSGLLVPAIFLIFILLKDRLDFIKNKDYWIFLLTFILFFIPQLIYSKIYFGSSLAIFSSGYAESLLEKIPFGWYNLKFIYLLTENVAFILFVIGAVMFLKFFLYLDVMIKDKKKVLNPQLFSILTILIVSCFYIFYIKGTEDRWVFLWLPFIFYIISFSLIFLFNKTKNYNHLFAYVLVAILIGFIGYNQIQHGWTITNQKYNSYGPIKDAGLWIKDNSIPGDKVLSISFPQIAHYSERNVSSYSKLHSEDQFLDYIKFNRPDFIQISIFEPHPKIFIQQVNENGYDALLLPIFNSSIIFKDNRVLSYNLNREILIDDINFELVYPKNRFDGVFVYRITYNQE
jgi:4-amino-4-deoxy-L-arabinose transferase-like glycosyltransferase